ncbi:MAG TPA: hypothetical protein VHL80_00450 [Polyangia bacterium]|nr:hypothetical protein [Polyangia bacterium]
MSARRPVRASALAVFLSLSLLGGGGPARAYDPATTHAGLTERSVLASGLHQVLSRRLGRPLGLFEPLRLREADVGEAEARSLRGRLGALDPSGGYRPAADGVASALSWVVAGSVIAGTPAERGRNLFYDPSRGTGLGGAGDAAAFSHAMRALFDDGTFRALATGTDFNLTGLPATEWLASPDNDVGLPAFTSALDAAVSAPDPAARGTALARALLALGGTLAVLQDAGEPAHVRNDFAGAYLGGGGDNPFDRSSAFERFVADRYGRLGLPAAAPPVARPTVMAYITAADRQGLADRTQRRFFSAGTLPEDAIVDRDTSAVEVMRDARGSLAYGLPRLPRLELRALGERRYAFEGPRRLLAYERVPGRVRFFLDDAVYADTARVLLPEIAAYGAGLVDHLFRVELAISAKDGAVTVEARGASGALDGRVRVYAEDARGRRTELGAGALVGSDGAARVTVAVAPPSGTRRLAAVLRGRDAAGELVSVVEAPL